MQPAPTPDQSEFHPEGSLSPQTILLVDDNEQLRRLASFGLRLAGFTVLEATDGVKAMEIAAKHEGRINLLIADVRMPRMDGPALAKQLAASRPDVKILLMSGAELPADSSENLDRTFEFIPKPFSASSLARKAKSILSQRQA
jgi:two-component system, cell cycle sensor histidine kinase and response regulator CckA